MAIIYSKILAHFSPRVRDRSALTQGAATIRERCLIVHNYTVFPRRGAGTTVDSEAVPLKVGLSGVQISV